MRYLNLILSLFAFISTYADHLLGGEVTYQHISGTKYALNVVLYRDCNGSKLGGTGGGSSNSNHTDLTAAYIRTINGSSCSAPNQNIGTIYLSKSSYEDITKVCAGTNTACDLNTNFNYGIEAHYYSGTVDFENYSAYQGCAFELYISISDRSTSLNTMQDGTNFYNYAIINPWIDNAGSPQFSQVPQLLYSANRPVYENAGVLADKSTDSLSYSWDAPLKAHNTPIGFKSGFSASQFITPYCPGGDCTPNPAAAIPEGIFLDSDNGNMIFTPTQTAQFGTRVLRVEQWRKLNGQMSLLSVVRRDIVVAVALNSQNYAPKIEVNDQYEFCEGDYIQIPVNVTDINSDSVSLVCLSPNGISDSIEVLSYAPYARMIIYGNADSGLVGEHYIIIQAKDNNCPAYGESNRMIKITVHPKARILANILDKFCGNMELEYSSDLTGSSSLKVFDNSTGQQLYSAVNQNMYSYTSFAENSLAYELTFTTDKNCTSVWNGTFQNKGSSAVENATLIGSLEYCEGETTNLSLTHPMYTITTTEWYKNTLLISSDSVLTSPAFQGLLNYHYILENQAYQCVKFAEAQLIVNSLPEISVPNLSALCYSRSTLDLSGLNATPSNGNWSSNDLTIEGNQLDLSLLANEDRTYVLNYSYTDPNTLCTQSNSAVLNILKAPEMELKDIVQCGAGNKFRLTNAIVKPAHFSPENIQWDVIGFSSYLSGIHPFVDLDIPSLGIGTFNIVATNTALNGCISKDTSWLRVDQGLSITTNGKTFVCQSNKAINLTEYLAINAPGGGWFSNNASEMLNGQMLTPEKCGDYNFVYTYDAFGCYAQIELALTIICKPEMQVELPSQLCENSSPIELHSGIANGIWLGQGVSNGYFNPAIGAGIYPLSYTVVVNNECAFKDVYQLEVIEPATVALYDLPAKLCEGEPLEFNFTKDAYSTLSVNSCGNSIADIKNFRIRYLPADCDLANGSIQLVVQAHSLSSCPASSALIDIPYFELPDIAPVMAINECWPYNLQAGIEVLKGINPDINFTISSAEHNFNGSGTQMNYAFPQAGIYSLNILLQDVSGCSNAKMYNDIFSLHHKPTAGFSTQGEDIISASDRELLLYNSSTIAQGKLDYTWSYSKGGVKTIFSNNTNPVFELPADTGKYTIHLLASSNKGCVDSASTDVWLVPDVLVFIPNAFTPNNKGPQQNNAFKVTSLNCSQFKIKIYNRFGQKVFQSDDILEGWDGTYLGKDCQSGVYIYYIDLVNKAGMVYKYQGTLNLLR